MLTTRDCLGTTLLWLVVSALALFDHNATPLVGGGLGMILVWSCWAGWRP